VIAGYKDKPGALIPVLQLAQGIFGYLPEVALKHVALKLGKPYSEVAGVVGFYSFFRPCRRQARHQGLPGDGLLRAAAWAVLDAPQEGPHDRRRADHRRPQFSLEVGRCFGACGLAPCS